jgi:hypothetical protein
MFTPERVFSIKNPTTGDVTWYFQAREGDFGPYESKAEAKSMLKDYIEDCIKTGNDGGRNEREKAGKPANPSGNNKRKPIIKYLGKRTWY